MFWKVKIRILNYEIIMYWDTKGFIWIEMMQKKVASFCFYISDIKYLNWIT